jgi:hypothetical protein
MWVMTTVGMFSVVVNRQQPGHVLVRARARKDLEALLARVKDVWQDSDILRTPTADYRYRVSVPKTQWAEWVYALAQDIDYSNFKDRIHAINPHRADIYADVWATCLDIEREEFLDAFLLEGGHEKKGGEAREGSSRKEQKTPAGRPARRGEEGHGSRRRRRHDASEESRGLVSRR